MSATDSSSFPVPGTTWLDSYEIIEALSDAGSGQAWKARAKGTQKYVQIRLGKALDQGREKAWELLCSLSNSAPILRPHARHLAAERAFEVYDLPPTAVTLTQWKQKRGLLSEAELTSCVKALDAGIGAMHRTGLVHLALSPDAILVEEDSGKMRVLIGGLELATLRDQKELIPIPVDPLYAPPEAAGLYKHPPGDRLITWDSFAFGRILQFLFLGRHVLGLVLNRDVSVLTPDLKERAEMLAFERLDGHLRAGALEDMVEVPPRINLLLRGLLASSWEARWRDEEVQMWLNGDSPREHYALATKERCYRHAGQSCTISEAAEQLRNAEHWDEATESVFNEELPGSLAAFMKEEAPDPVLKRMEVLKNMSTDTWFKQYPEQAQRDVLTALALQQLSGGKLIWRGKRVDASLLLEMLEREDGTGQWLARARMLCAPQVLALLDVGDAEAARVLGEVGRHAKKAEDKSRQQRWLQSSDLLASASIWRMACQLQRVPAIIAALRGQYACSTQPAVQALFATEKPGIDEQLVLCHMAVKPTSYDFLTHEEYAARRHAELHAEGMRLAEMLFWKRLRRALGTSPWWFGRIWWLAGCWGIFALLFAFVKPGPGWLAVALAPAALALGMRGMLLANLQPILSVHFPQARAWRYWDGPERCDAAKNELRSINELGGLLTDINAQIGKLSALQPPPPKVIVPPSFSGLRNTALCSWLMLAGLLGYLGWQATITPPSLDGLFAAWASKPEDLDKLAAEQETEDEAREETRIPWPHTKIPAELRTLAPIAQPTPTRPQEVQALRTGKAMLAKFLPSTINVPILVPLPSEQNFIYALYDGKNRVLATKTLIVLTSRPMPRTWVEVAGKKVFVYAE